METFNKSIVFVVEDLVGLWDYCASFNTDKITIFLYELK